MEHKDTSETCWFCGKRKADDASRASVEMHRRIKDDDTDIQTLAATWEPGTVYVPRCPSCKGAHDRTENHVQRGWRVGLPVGIVLGVLTFIYLFGRWWIVPLVALGIAILGGIIAWLISRAFSSEAVRDQGYATIHPNVRRKQEEGWKIGANPIGRTS
jgi:hypothetical protein